MESNKPTISVIVPVYNVEKYIERCVRSLFQQTLNDIEYIFVDDCGKDQSISLLKRVLEEYPDKKECVQIISHERNLGSAAARHTGLQRAKGEYVIYCDSDDWVAENMYELLYNEAKNGNYDIVYCNYAEVRDNIFVLASQDVTCYSDQDYLEKLLSGELGAYLWNKLIRRKLYERIDIPFGKNMWEDLYMCVQMFYYAQNIMFLNSNYLYFHNATNVQCITYLNPKRNFYDMMDNITSIEFFLDRNNIDKSYLYSRKMYCKMIMLVSGYELEKWNEIFPEVNKKIYDNKEIPNYLKLVTWTLNHNIYIVRSLYIWMKSVIKLLFYSKKTL